MRSCWWSQAAVAAGLLFRWHNIKVLETSEINMEKARNMVVTCRLHCHDLNKSDVVYRVGDPLTSDFVESDVLFLDATQLGFDEVALVQGLRQKLEELVCGTFIIICTHVEDPFLGDCPFQKLDWGASYTAPEPSHRHVLLYKTIRRSKDSRTAATQSRARARATRARDMLSQTRLDATFAESMSLQGVNLAETAGLDSLLN